MTTYFERVFGFVETGDYRANQEKLAKMLKWDAQHNVHYFYTPQGRIDAGSFETPSVAELRESIISQLNASQFLRMRISGTGINQNIVGDSMAMCRDPQYLGCVVQAASQPNGLEMASPNRTPEEGIENYKYDKTQGPACAIPAFAGTAFRNYFGHLKPGELPQTNENPQGKPLTQCGQTSTRSGPGQLNLFANAFKVIEDWVRTTKNVPNFKLLREIDGYQNGYVYSDTARMKLVEGFFDNPVNKEQFIQALRIGIQRDTSVLDADGKLLPHKLTQTYNSAISAFGYSDGTDPNLWKPIAKHILIASYEASMLVQVQENIRRVNSGAEPKPILLTKLGGGVFQNDPEWIKDAMLAAITSVKEQTGCSLGVNIVHFSTVEASFRDMPERIKSKMDDSRYVGVRGELDNMKNMLISGGIGAINLELMPNREPGGLPVFVATFRQEAQANEFKENAAGGYGFKPASNKVGFGINNARAMLIFQDVNFDAIVKEYAQQSGPVGYGAAAVPHVSHVGVHPAGPAGGYGAAPAPRVTHVGAHPSGPAGYGATAAPRVADPSALAKEALIGLLKGDMFNKLEVVAAQDRGTTWSPSEIPGVDLGVTAAHGRTIANTGSRGLSISLSRDNSLTVYDKDQRKVLEGDEANTAIVKMAQQLELVEDPRRAAPRR